MIRLLTRRPIFAISIPLLRRSGYFEELVVMAPAEDAVPSAPYFDYGGCVCVMASSELGDF